MTKSIDYKKPPVVEVVCGAAFQRLDAFKAPHIGTFWKTLPKEFCQVEETTPVGYPDDPSAFEVLEVPPHPRVWFHTEDGGELIQLQQNRFFYNWKRRDGGANDKYPEFTNIFPKFLQYLELFRKFVTDEQLGTVEFHQFELTYVNHIMADSVEGQVKRYSNVLLDHVSDTSRQRFLPEPDRFRWLTSYEMPNGMGRLHVTAQSALKKSETREKLLRLDLAVRGTSQDTSDDGMKAWFSVAHNWIVEGFSDITDRTVQDEIWRRIQ